MGGASDFTQALIRSIGIGKTTVVFFSMPISVNVCMYRNWIAAGCVSRTFARTVRNCAEVTITGCTIGCPDDAFVVQVARTLPHADDGALRAHCLLIGDRDTKWSEAVRRTLAAAGIRVVQTPYHAPNCHAHAERFVRSSKEECLDRQVILGEAHLRRALREFTAHYHQERNHQGLHDELIAPGPIGPPNGTIRCRPRLGGLLHYYDRAA